MGDRGAKVVLESLLGPALPDLPLLYDVRLPQGDVLVGASEGFLGEGVGENVDDWRSVGVGGVLMMTGPGVVSLLGGVAGGRPTEMRAVVAGEASWETSE